MLSIPVDWCGLMLMPILPARPDTGQRPVRWHWNAKSGNLPLLRYLTMSTDMQEETQRLNSSIWYGTAATMRNFGITVWRLVKHSLKSWRVKADIAWIRLRKKHRNSIGRHIVWDIFVRTARRSCILSARICRTLSTQVLICGIPGLFRHFVVPNIRLHRNMWRCSHGPTVLRLTGKRRKQKVSWMQCSWPEHSKMENNYCRKSY